MFFSGNLRKTFFFSLVSHLVVASAFSLTFGKKLPARQFLPISFWGGVLPKVHVIVSTAPGLRHLAINAAITPTIASLNTADQDTLALPHDFLKLHLGNLYIRVKETHQEMPIARGFALRKQEPTIVFHPLLPYSFILYFKNRQTVHVELEFKVERVGQQNIISVKRKISSGNPEADLLTMRYIEQYLFVQQAAAAPTPTWQTVKIDLSAKE